MNRKLTDVVDSDTLRHRAEFRLASTRGGFFARKSSMVSATQMLVHELQVHQVELEMQNESLLLSRVEVDEGNARYMDLFELGPVPYMTLGIDGGIRQINLTGANLLGMRGPRLVGKRLRQLVAAHDRPTFDEFLSKMVGSHTKKTCEVEVHPGAGVSIFVEFTGVSVGDGQECRLVATDITTRKQQERDREELQAQLAQSRKMEAIGTLAGGIAHDFNNILGGILGGLSLLELQMSKNSELYTEIQEMEELVHRGSNLTRQLLGFACRGNYDVRPLDLAEVVKRTSTMFGRTRKDVTIQIDVASDLRAVLMDHTQLEQVLLNILVNAGQAMSEGGKIHLRAVNLEFFGDQPTPQGAVPGKFVELKIADSGVGIDVLTQARIFEPFFTTKEPGQGTGLGLASAYGIIKSHGGSIVVESEPGQGTVFTLTVPAADGQTVSERPPAAEIQRGTGTILVVDDEAQMVRVYSRLLRKIGYKVLTASSGKLAHRALRLHKEKISLVILDMIMPDMNGRQTYDGLKKIAPDIKVLLCTGYSIDGQAQDIMARGCNGFIQKPFDAAILSAKLKKILCAGC